MSKYRPMNPGHPPPTRLFPILCLLALPFWLDAQCISGNCANGTGIYRYPSGARYIGEFKDGEINGIGTCYYSDGSQYRGQWTNRYPDGEGIKSLADGRQWKGSWRMGVPIDSLGQPIVELFPEVPAAVEEVQSGCLAGDCQEGEGLYAYPDGSKYEGSFTAEKPDGNGIYTYVNGNRYVGAFRQGHPHGQGVLHYPDSTFISGEWRDGEYLGNPVIAEDVVGCLEGDCDNGTGTYVFKDAVAKYSGRFRNGVPDGEGIIYYSNGGRYRGEWSDGNFSGKGTFYLSDGTEIAGYWKDGNFMGQEKPVPTLPAVTPEVDPEAYLAVQRALNFKTWAVIVGIADYNHMPALRYTDDDAYRYHSFLKSPEGGAVKDEHIRLLINEDATANNIREAMQDVFRQAGPDDLVILYFSGHGLKGAFLPIDYNGYNNKLEHEEIRQLFGESQAKYKLCIADACHSGSLMSIAEKSGTVRNVLEDYYRTLSEAKAGMALIMSSKSEETSLESSGLRRGVFSHFLLRGLKGEADTDQNKLITVQELYDYISGQVRAYTQNRQTPVITGDYDPDMTVGGIR